MAFTPLQMAAGNGIVQNSAFKINQQLVDKMNEFAALPMIGETDALLADIDASTLSNAEKDQLKAAVLAIPGTHDLISAGTSLRSAITTWADKVLPPTQQSRFVAHFQAAAGHVSTINEIVNSAANGSKVAKNSFTSMDELSTGNISLVSTNPQKFGQDLVNTGILIDFSTLSNYGTPDSLFKVLVGTNMINTLEQEFVARNVQLSNLISEVVSNGSLSPANQRAVYDVSTTITGKKLEDILLVLQIETQGIVRLSDLMNTKKLFPQSFNTLRSMHNGAPENIYINNGVAPYVSSLKTRNSAFMPEDVAKANYAFAMALQQIKKITDITPKALGEQAKGIELNTGLSAINSQTSAMDETAANELNSEFAKGTNKNGSYYFKDVIGTVAGYVHTDTYTTLLSLAGDIDYGDVSDAYDDVITELGGAADVPTMEGFLADAKTYMETEYPDEVAAWTEAMDASNAQILREETALTDAEIYNGSAFLSTESKKAAMAFASTLGILATKTEQAELLELVADQTTHAGQSLVAALREGRNLAKLNAAGVGSDSSINPN
jgi:hypothetical protein